MEIHYRVGFSIVGGWLMNRGEGEQMIIDRAARVLNDSVVIVDVRFTYEVPALDNPETGPQEPNVALLVRYRNPEGYYAVGISDEGL